MRLLALSCTSVVLNKRAGVTCAYACDPAPRPIISASSIAQHTKSSIKKEGPGD